MGSEDKTILEYAPPKPRRMWRPSRGFLICLVSAGAVAFAIRAWRDSVQNAVTNNVGCAAQMRRIGQMLHIYNAKTESGPPSMSMLLDYIWRSSAPPDGDPRGRASQEMARINAVCFCPSSNHQQITNLVLVSDYILTAAAATRIDRLAPNTIVLYETACRHNGRMNILFADGSVRSISAAESQAMLADLNAGKNPPPSWQSKVGR